MKYTELQLSDLMNSLKNGIALIVTATQTETNAIHNKLKPLPGFDSIVKVYVGDATYFFGVFGNYCVGHVQCAMGSISRDSSIVTVTGAISALSPKLVIMIGIAFGINSRQQNIGDVLVSECVVPYDFKRVGENGTIHRSASAPASKFLLNRFKSTGSWEYILKNEKKAKVFYVHLLSGESLIDNKVLKNQIS